MYVTGCRRLIVNFMSGWPSLSVHRCALADFDCKALLGLDRSFLLENVPSENKKPLWVRTEMVIIAFSFAAPSAWNMLQSELKRSEKTVWTFWKNNVRPLDSACVFKLLLCSHWCTLVQTSINEFINNMSEPCWYYRFILGVLSEKHCHHGGSDYSHLSQLYKLIHCLKLDWDFQDLWSTLLLRAHSMFYYFVTGIWIY